MRFLEGKGEEGNVQKLASQSPLIVPATTAVMHKKSIQRLRIWKLDGGQYRAFGTFLQDSGSSMGEDVCSWLSSCNTFSPQLRRSEVEGVFIVE